MGIRLGVSRERGATDPGRLGQLFHCPGNLPESNYHASVRRTRAVAGAFLAGVLVLTLSSLPAYADDPASGDSLAAPATGASTDAGDLSSQQAQQALEQAEELGTPDIPAEATPAAETAHGRSATLTLTQLWRARPLLSGADRRSANRILARPMSGAFTRSDLFALNPDKATLDCTTSARFCIHYTTVGSDRSTAEFAARVARTMDQVYAALVGRLHYRAPASDAEPTASPSNPNGKFDVFLGNLGADGYYGYCAPEDGGRSYCALDNDFAEFAGGPDRALPVTAAHEFFHAIQFGYDAFEDTWLMEGSAVWAEDQVFDSLNDYTQFIRDSSAITQPGLPVDLDTLSGPHAIRVYSAMLFFNHLTETLGVDSMRRVWEAARGRRYSIQAVRKVVSARMSWSRFMARWSVWNTRPPGYGYSEHALLPAGRFRATRYLGLRARKTSAFTVRRDHLSAASYRFKVSRKSTKRQRIRFRIDGPRTSRGSVATVQMRWQNGRTTYAVARLKRDGDAVLTRPFGRGQVRMVIVTLINASTAMTRCGTNALTVYSCSGFGRYPHDLWRLSAKVIR